MELNSITTDVYNMTIPTITAMLTARLPTTREKKKERKKEIYHYLSFPLLIRHPLLSPRKVKIRNNQTSKA
jgi:hypothetical protein